MTDVASQLQPQPLSPEQAHAVALLAQRDQEDARARDVAAVMERFPTTLFADSPEAQAEALEPARFDFFDDPTEHSPEEATTERGPLVDFNWRGAVRTGWQAAVRAGAGVGNFIAERGAPEVARRTRSMVTRAAGAIAVGAEWAREGVREGADRANARLDQSINQREASEYDFGGQDRDWSRDMSDAVATGWELAVKAAQETKKVPGKIKGLVVRALGSIAAGMERVNAQLDESVNERKSSNYRNRDDFARRDVGRRNPDDRLVTRRTWATLLTAPNDEAAQAKHAFEAEVLAPETEEFPGLEDRGGLHTEPVIAVEENGPSTEEVAIVDLLGAPAPVKHASLVSDDSRLSGTHPEPRTKLLTAAPVLTEADENPPLPLDSAVRQEEIDRLAEIRRQAVVARRRASADYEKPFQPRDGGEPTPPEPRLRSELPEGHAKLGGSETAFELDSEGNLAVKSAWQRVAQRGPEPAGELAAEARLRRNEREAARQAKQEATQAVAPVTAPEDIEEAA